MRQADYREYTLQTIESYPIKHRKYLQTLLMNAGFIQKGSQVLLANPDAVYTSELELEEQIAQCINNDNPEISNGSLGIFEEWEFERDYKYSVLFSTVNFDSLVDSVRNNAVIFDKNSADFSISSPLSGKMRKSSVVRKRGSIFIEI